MEFISRSPKETQEIGTEFAKKLIPRTAKAPVVIGLFGDLGSGKTTFVQGMAKGLGIDPRHYVNSPTFTLVNEYEPRKKGTRLIHVDLYRIEKAAEAETLALEEYLGSGHIVVVEWAERVPEWEKRLDYRVRFEGVSSNARRIFIEKNSLTYTH